MERKVKRYDVSKHFKNTLTFAVVGLAYLCIYLRLQVPTEVTAANVRSLKDDQHVRITMNRYLVKKWKGDTLPVEVDGSYMVCIGNSAYLLVIIEDKQLISVLESYSEGRGESISFEGWVSKKDPNPVVDLYHYLLYNILDPDLLVNDAVVYQMNEKPFPTAAHVFLVDGCLFIVTALVLFFTVGGIRVIYVKPFEDSKRYKECVFSHIYNLEEELQRERYILESLIQQQRKAKRRGYIGFVLFFCGIPIFFNNMVLLVSDTSIYINLYYVLGIYIGRELLFKGWSWLWNAFINSDLSLAQWLSDRYLLRTLSVKKEESSKIINILNLRLKERRELEEAGELQESEESEQSTTRVGEEVSETFYYEEDYE